jgi:P-type Cu2+ transporter
VQVVAAGRLLASGVILKDGAALEKLAEIDTVIFDKTGTLTCGRPRLVERPALSAEQWGIAAALAGASRHPLARALCVDAEARGGSATSIEAPVEYPGLGVEARLNGERLLLGRPQWVGGEEANEGALATEVWLRIGDAPAIRFGFADDLRADAAATVARIKASGREVRLLSGDCASVVARIAAEAGIETSIAQCLPRDKVEALQRLASEGRRVLMVGDGLNDAPALAAAHVSMSPASGADITQAAADLVFTGERLAPVVTALTAARTARRKIMQNFALAVGYNLIAVPVAILGFATPLIAAVAMSASSMLVVANALTLSLALREESRPAPRTSARAPRIAAA